MPLPRHLQTQEKLWFDMQRDNDPLKGYSIQYQNPKTHTQKVHDMLKHYTEIIFKLTTNLFYQQGIKILDGHFGLIVFNTCLVCLVSIIWAEV